MLTQTHTVVNSRFFSLPHTPICAKKKNLPCLLQQPCTIHTHTRERKKKYKFAKQNETRKLSREIKPDPIYHPFTWITEAVKFINV